MKNFESKEPCLVCSKKGSGLVTYHHVHTRKASPEREYDPDNLMPLCSNHHSLIHTRGLSYMAKTYESIHNWLIENGWNYCEFMKRWTYDMILKEGKRKKYGE